MFLKRAREYLDNNIEDSYLKYSLEYMKNHFDYLKENKFVDDYIMERYEEQRKLIE